MFGPMTGRRLARSGRSRKMVVMEAQWIMSPVDAGKSDLTSTLGFRV